MGAGASKSPEFGVPINPRVQYAAKRSANENKPMLIDAPALVKLDNAGTVRYRYMGEEQDDKQLQKRTEKPHEGPERKQKNGYFHHTKLNDFSENASYDKEEEWRFCYVYKGPEKTKQKRMYYVFGKGLKNATTGFIKPDSDQPEEQPQPNVFYKQHGHVYYDLIFPKQEEDLSRMDEQDDMKHRDDRSTDLCLKEMMLVLKDTDKIEHLKRRLSVRLVKTVGLVQIYEQGCEVENSQVIGKLRRGTDSVHHYFPVLLCPK